MDQAVNKAQPVTKKHPREIRHEELTADSLGLLNLMKECDMMEIFALGEPNKPLYAKFTDND
jgi:hypothetical protein